MSTRCFDCFSEFGPDEDRFAVLKKLRDDAGLTDRELHPAERAMYHALAHDQVFVCGDCAGWYGDLALPVTAAEAESA